MELEDRLLDLFFPRKCVGCGRTADFICSACQQTLPRVLSPVCPHCDRTVAEGGVCSACKGHSSPLDGRRSPFRFEGAIRQAIISLKYRNIRALARPLAQFLHDYTRSSPVPGDVLVPVPLHSRRLRECGYNQAALMARELSKLSSIPVGEKTLVRRRYISPQARSSALAERYRNVEGAFECVDVSSRGKAVLLIDDVCTSGATLEACATALKMGGAASVWGLVLAQET